VRRAVLVVALGAALGAVPVRILASGWPPTGAAAVACDVGQGDAVVLPIGAGDAVVVDAGPDPVAVDACLRRLGVRTVSLLVITHFHADHMGGLAGVLRGRELGGVALPTYDEPAAGESAVRETVGTRPVVEVEAGWRYSRGGLELRVLGPTRTWTGTRSDPNNNSLVLRVVNRGITVLLAGDAENEAQHDLLSLDRSLMRADVLKLAHHGSPYQDPDLLDAVDPTVAMVSAGRDNQYGHPNPALLSRLERDGARVLRTDLDGDVAVVATSSGIGAVVAGSQVSNR
jgi:competence protein ComEC